MSVPQNLWKNVIEGIMNQSTGSNTDDRIAKIVLVKQMPESDVHLDENLKEIRKFLITRRFNVRLWDRLKLKTVNLYRNLFPHIISPKIIIMVLFVAFLTFQLKTQQ